MKTTLHEMRCRKVLVLAALFLGLLLLQPDPALAENGNGSGESAGPSWWARLRTTIYSFDAFGLTEEEDGEEDEEDDDDRLSAYQHFDGSVRGLANGRLDLRVGGRFADDLNLDERVHDRSRLHVAYAQARLGPHNISRVRLGRQFVQEGPTSRTLDGAWVQLSLHRRVQFRAWGGAPAPSTREFELGEFSEEATFGFRVVGRVKRCLRVAASWAQRKFADEIVARPLAFEATVAPKPGLRAIGKVSYDLWEEELEKIEFLGQWRPRPDLPIFSAQFLDRRPALERSPYFARFGELLERIRVARVTGRHEVRQGFGAEAHFFGAFVDERNSSRVGLALFIPWVTVGYSARLGDTGEESRFYGDVSYAPLPWLVLEGGATVSTYELVEDASESEDGERDITTGFARVRADLRPGLRVILEVQGLDDPSDSDDLRFLAGVDLLMGRGSTNVGLGTGGWLQ